MAIKAIVFDAGGVLRDYYTPINLANWEILKKIGVKISFEKIEKIDNEIEREYGYQIVKKSRNKLASFFIRHILEKLDKKFDKKYEVIINDTAKNTSKKLRHYKLKPFPDVLPAIKKLEKNFRIVTLSNVHDLHKHEEFLKNSGLFNHFEFHENSIALKIRKPDKRIFLHVVRRLKLKPNEVAIIGDTPSIDIFGGKRVGMLTILINRRKIKYKFKKEFQPDYEIYSLNDLFKIPQIKKQMIL